MRLYEFLRLKGHEIFLTEDRKVSIKHRLWAHGPRVTTFSFGDDFSLHEILTDPDVEKFFINVTGAKLVTEWQL